MTLSIYDLLIIFTDLSRATNLSCICSRILTIKLLILLVYFILRQTFAMGENANIILTVKSSFLMVSFANDRKQHWTQQVSFIIFRKFQYDLLNFTLQYDPLKFERKIGVWKLKDIYLRNYKADCNSVTILFDSVIR